ncbi:hypothetical protein [Parasedimentitalea maritima]|uniref:Uncharacterized protein n=1 Tax=Parasedimentitalea maritima TaxID=2578117 RepID=A0A6A4RGW5_9RHOB|nr:hypothetical protein [Zongyanglinia marina]KAE9628464.1 hypothetical protein GP644_14875 [Zongyanglinia marina]
MPRELDLTKLSLFEPVERRGESEDVPKMQKPAVDSQREAWSSREPIIADGQISVKAPMKIIERFKKMCKDDRRTYADMLRILMDNFDKGEGGVR